TGLGLKIKYLHSDIDTIERVEIINGLRSGEFDILVGINLLREGLDIPEVALVAILDADREGFLRSYRSLIQTIGRAARNVKGRVILYAYKQTDSMNKAIDETNRRRQIQVEHNLKENIEPKTIIKKINSGVIETLRGAKRRSTTKRKEKLVNLNIESIDQQITILKKEMKIASKELRFEDAAMIRDEIKELVEARLLV
ncbi:MAG: excinuclease ABC subunit B, partial [Bdellovibrionales bacterium]|nr:excinuclease ABC subunit B [Bdellovibrionales bacterium]